MVATVWWRDKILAVDSNCFVDTQPPLIRAPASFQRMTAHLVILGWTVNPGTLCVPSSINIKAVEHFLCARHYHRFTQLVLTSPQG